METTLTLSEAGRLYYRGREVGELARSFSFEQVAWWLWTGAEPSSERRPGLACPEATRIVVRRAGTSLPESARVVDCLRVAVAAAATVDPFGRDVRPDGVLATAPRLLAAMVEALGSGSAAETQRSGPRSVAERVWSALAPNPPDRNVSLMNAALVLVADHDLATSTLAARVAASTRADPYAVVSAGLGVLDGPLHGEASLKPYRLFMAVEGGISAEVALADHVRTQDALPGFGHFLYPGGDPRAAVLLELLRTSPLLKTSPMARDRWEIVETVSALAEERAWRPNVDFALAALAFGAGMSEDAGEAIFAIGRTAGWLAHALEEYDAPTLRFRPRGRYVGPPPRRPLDHDGSTTQECG